MLALFLLSTVGTLAIGAAVGLIDFSDTDPNEEIDENDLEEKVGLLDDTEIQELETAFAEDPLLAQETYLDEDAQLTLYDDTNWSDNQGTDGNDFMQFPDELSEEGSDPLFAGAGDDVLLGSDVADRYEVMFGEDGDDTLFGRAGEDWLFGDDGNDILSGGDQGDLLVGGEGSDLIYGGDGDDNIYDDGYSGSSEIEDTDVINAGAGNDGVVISDGINLVSLGEGEDHLMLFTEHDDNPGAVVTDFDPSEDALLIGVYSESLELPEDVNAIELDYTLSEIETSLGSGTLVQPAVADETLAADLGDYSAGYVVLLGVTPDELSDAEIRVILESDETESFTDELSLHSAANDMGATRL